MAALRTVFGLALSALLVVAGTSPSRALSPLPFTPEFSERVETTFFEGNGASAEKVERYRTALHERRDEAASVFAAELWAEGRGRKSAGRKAAGRKVVETYDLLIGGKDGGGWLDDLMAAADPVAARRLAGKIIEIDYALLVEGDHPFTKKLPEHLGSIGVFEWNVPGSTPARKTHLEARDLIDPKTGLFFEYDDLRDLVEGGADLSQLDPPSDGDVWQDRGALAGIDVRESYYRGGHAIHRGLGTPFPPTGGTLRRIRKSQTKPKFEIEVEVEGAPRRYKLKVGGETFSEPVTGAVLSVLGFNADVVMHVENFRMDLGDLSVEELRHEWRSYFEFSRLHLSYNFDDYFTVHEDESGTYVIAAEASLTAKPSEVTRVGPWPWGDNGNEGRRAVRALGIVSAWLGNTDMKEAENNKLLLRDDADGRPRVYHLHHDLGHAFGRVMSEQIEAFPWQLASRRPDDRIFLNYKSTWNPTLRKNITFADGRWIVRRIGQLSRAQIEQAVALGGWPDAVGKLLAEKLVARRNQLVEAFDLLGETTPSGPLALLPVDREITTDDQRVVDGTLKDGAYEDMTKQFDNYWGEFLGPVWEAAKLTGVATFQKTIGMVPSIIFDKDSVGAPRWLIADLLITLKREVEENPRPEHEGEFYLTNDQLLLGVRVGGGLIGYGGTSFYRSWTLVQPSGTLRDAHYVGDRILDVRLPYHIRRQDLPDEYVLTRETYVDGRIGVITESTGGSVASPIGARGSLGRVRLSRDVVARKDGRLRLYEDVAKYTDRELEAFFNLVFLRIPFAFNQVEDGHMAGTLYDFSTQDLAGEDEWADGLAKVLARGDFSFVEEHGAGVPISSDFRDREGWFRIPYFFGRGSDNHFGRIDFANPERPSDIQTSHLQYSTSGSGYWNFLDWGEAYRHVISTTSMVEPETQQADTPAIVSTYYQRDRDTKDAELGDAYLRFINGLPGDGKPLIDFTPALHTENGVWGDLEVKVRIGYTKKAVRRLRKLDPEEFRRRLAEALEVSPKDHARYRALLGVHGKQRGTSRARVPRSIRTHLLRADVMLRDLARAKDADQTEEWMRDLADALSRASPRRGGWYDPTLLGVLHSMLGRKQVSIEAMVLPPPWVENRLVGSVPLSGSTGRKIHGLDRQPVDLRPQCTVAVWEMLETFPSYEDGVLGWPEHPAAESGSPCDGSLAGFGR